MRQISQDIKLPFHHSNTSSLRQGLIKYLAHPTGFPGGARDKNPPTKVGGAEAQV